MWDAMCNDTFAPCYWNLAVPALGLVAATPESLKKEKYSDLSYTHEFAAISVESSGVFELQSLSFLKELGRRLIHQIGEEKGSTYLMLRLDSFKKLICNGSELVFRNTTVQYTTR